MLSIKHVTGPGGAGSSPATTTGSSNATGGADTKNESSKYVCGLGLSFLAVSVNGLKV